MGKTVTIFTRDASIHRFLSQSGDLVEEVSFWMAGNAIAAKDVTLVAWGPRVALSPLNWHGLDAINKLLELSVEQAVPHTLNVAVYACVALAWPLAYSSFVERVVDGLLVGKTPEGLVTDFHDSLVQTLDPMSGAFRFRHPQVGS